MMKIFAFYLPQFHEIPENNKWWGKGFTEWTNVKKSKPLFKNHFQPNLPLNRNFYDLSNDDVLRWQADYAKQKCKINGFSIYHYYFNGKLLLEKPSEILLKNKDIDIEYYFTWANESWTRSWDGKSNEILIEQKYGGQEDWNLHYEYLVRHFRDNRYLKIDNKPVLAIYKPKKIKDLKYMISFWIKKLKKEGFNGIYLININRGIDYDKRKLFDSEIIFEPTYTQYRNKVSLWSKRFQRFFMDKIINKPFPNIYDLNKIYNNSVKQKVKKNNTMMGAFINWDNSPRRGEKSTIFTNFNVTSFKEYFSKIFSKAIKLNCKFIVINAWNEWAEGTFIEPSEKYKHEIANAIHGVICNEKKY